jgi:hypothetical protein
MEGNLRWKRSSVSIDDDDEADDDDDDDDEGSKLKSLDPLT